MTTAAGTPSVQEFARETPEGDVVRGNTVGKAVYQSRVAGIKRVSEELTRRGLTDDDVYDRLTEHAAMHAPDEAGDDSFDFVSKSADHELEPEYRHAGPSLTPKQAKTVADVWRSLVQGPFEEVRPSAPKFAARAEEALASPSYARYLAQEVAPRTFSGEAPEAITRWTQQKQLDRLRGIEAGHVEPQEGEETAPAADLFGARSKAARRQSNIKALEAALPDNYEQSDEFTRINNRYHGEGGLGAELEDAAIRSGVPLSETARGHLRLAPRPPDETGPSFGSRGTGQRQASAAKTASGAGAYSTDPMDAIRADAADKIPKAARNEFYNELLKTPDAKVLAQDERLPADSKLVPRTFTRPGGQSAVRVAVRPEIARAFDHVEAVFNDRGPTTRFGVFAKQLGNLFGKFALGANPAATVGHSWTLSSVVGTTPERGFAGGLESLSGALPYGSSFNGLRKIMMVDRTDPAVQGIERNLMKAGGMRPPLDATEADDLYSKFVKKLGPAGKLVDGHAVLFGSNGVDPRSRVWLAKNFIDHATTSGRPWTWSQVARYVNDRAGSYIKGNGNALADWLNSNSAMFARFGVARLANAARTSVGVTNLPAASTAGRVANSAQMLAKGAVGAAIGLEGLNYLLSHHSTLKNAPGHEFDIQTGPDDKAKGNTYVRGALAFPTLATAGKSTGAGSALRGDSRGAIRDVGNTALNLALSHPAARAAATVAGVQPTMEREGGLSATGPHSASGLSDLLARGKQAAYQSTHLGQELAQPERVNPGMGPAGKVLGYLAPSITSHGNPVTAPVRQAKQDYDAIGSDAWRALGRDKGDTAAQRADIDRATEGLPDREARRLHTELMRAMKQVNKGTESRGMRRFEKIMPKP